MRHYSVCSAEHRKFRNIIWTARMIVWLPTASYMSHQGQLRPGVETNASVALHPSLARLRSHNCLLQALSLASTEKNGGYIRFYHLQVANYHR